MHAIWPVLPIIIGVNGIDNLPLCNFQNPECIVYADDTRLTAGAKDPCVLESKLKRYRLIGSQNKLFQIHNDFTIKLCQ